MEVGGEMQKFERLCDDFIDKNFEMHPEWATYAGVHDYDDRLGSSSDEAYAKAQRHVSAAMAALKKIDRDALPPESRLDYTLLKHALSGAEYEFKREDRRKTRPGAYIPTGSIFALLSRDFAPLADRVRNATSRLGEFPRVVAEGKHNLDRPPLLWTKLAMEQCDGARRFLTAVPDMARPATDKDADLGCALAQALDVADKSLADYRGFLEVDVLPRSDGAFAVGREAFDFYTDRKVVISRWD